MLIGLKSLETGQLENLLFIRYALLTKKYTPLITKLFFKNIFPSCCFSNLYFLSLFICMVKFTQRTDFSNCFTMVSAVPLPLTF